MSAYLHAFGAYLPDRVVTNAELAGRLGCSEEWIEKASGIRERRWAGAERGVGVAGRVVPREALLRPTGSRAPFRTTRYLFARQHGIWICCELLDRRPPRLAVAVINTPQ